MFSFFFNVIYWLFGAYFAWSYHEMHKDDYYETLNDSTDYYDQRLAKGWMCLALVFIFFMWPVYLIIRFFRNK